MEYNIKFFIANTTRSYMYALRSIYEVALVMLPAATWIVVIYSTGGAQADIQKLPAWPFAALSLFSSMLRDGISAFDRTSGNDGQERDLIVVASLIGMVISTVLLTLSALQSSGTLLNLVSFFYQIVNVMVALGAVLLLGTKFSLFKQRYYKKDV
jgi:hypothetical protein